MKTRFIILTTLLLLNVNANADNIICLSNKTGRLLIRASKCKKNESLATITLLGQSINNAKLITTTTGATGPKGDKGDKGDTGAKGETGVQGEKGSTGPQGSSGINGTNGSNGVSGRQIVTNTGTTNIAAANTVSVISSCPIDKVAVGGSCTSNNINVIMQSSTVADGLGSLFGCVFKNSSGSTVNATLTATAVCIH